MNAAIGLAGVEWGKRQDALSALAAQHGVPFQRKYRFQEVHSLVQETRYLASVAALINKPELWDVLHMPSRTATMRCLAFRLLSFGGAWTHSRLVDPSTN